LHPYLLKIPLPWGGNLTIASYGFMIMCGFLLCLYIARRRARKLGIDPNDLLDAAVAALICGIVGARLFYILEDWEAIRQHPIEIIRIDKGGLVFYGGLAGGAIALFAVMLKKKMPILRTLDIAVSVLPLGHAFGRIGCFLNGCCYGHRTDSWVGIAFPRVLEPGNVGESLFNVGYQHIVGCPAYVEQLMVDPMLKRSEWSYPVHPTQLYEVGYNLLIFAALSFWLWRRWREGEVAWLYLVFYGSARFANEIVRATPAVMAGLSIAQVICVPLILVGFVMFVRGRLKPSQPFPAPLPERTSPPKKDRRKGRKARTE